MHLICPNCMTQYEVSDSAIPEEGRDVQCAACSHVWFQEKVVNLREVPLQLGGAAAAGAVASPSENAPQDVAQDAPAPAEAETAPEQAMTAPEQPAPETPSSPVTPDMKEIFAAEAEFSSLRNRRFDPAPEQPAETSTFEPKESLEDPEQDFTLSPIQRISDDAEAFADAAPETRYEAPQFEEAAPVAPNPESAPSSLQAQDAPDEASGSVFRRFGESAEPEAEPIAQEPEMAASQFTDDLAEEVEPTPFRPFGTAEAVSPPEEAIEPDVEATPFRPFGTEEAETPPEEAIEPEIVEPAARSFGAAAAAPFQRFGESMAAQDAEEVQPVAAEPTPVAPEPEQAPVTPTPTEASASQPLSSEEELRMLRQRIAELERGAAGEAAPMPEPEPEPEIQRLEPEATPEPAPTFQDFRSFAEEAPQAAPVVDATPAPEPERAPISEPENTFQTFRAAAATPEPTAPEQPVRAEPPVIGDDDAPLQSVAELRAARNSAAESAPAQTSPEDDNPEPTIRLIQDEAEISSQAGAQKSNEGDAVLFDRSAAGAFAATAAASAAAAAGGLRRMAADDVPDTAAEKPSADQVPLPDVEELNTSLRIDRQSELDTLDADEEEAPKKPRRFVRGLLAAILIFLLIFLVYLLAEPLSKLFPGLAPFLEQFTGTVQSGLQTAEQSAENNSGMFDWIRDQWDRIVAGSETL